MGSYRSLFFAGLRRVQDIELDDSRGGSIRTGRLDLSIWIGVAESEFGFELESIWEIGDNTVDYQFLREINLLGCIDGVYENLEPRMLKRMAEL